MRELNLVPGKVHTMRTLSLRPALFGKIIRPCSLMIDLFDVCAGIIPLGGRFTGVLTHVGCWENTR